MIIGINGTAINDIKALQAVLVTVRPGDKVGLRVLRPSEKNLELTVQVIAGDPSLVQAQQADDAKKELAKLEGTWTIVKMEINGKSLLEKDKPEPKLVIKDGRVTSDATQAPKGGAELSKILDPSKNPKTVTLPLDGKVQFYGIYEVVGGELRVCGDGVDTAQEKNPEGRRPREFSSNKGLLIVLQREKK
jgi:uncharacterized protein (TIGR03067 family)